jgi:hypothetical protein
MEGPARFCLREGPDGARIEAEIRSSRNGPWSRTNPCPRAIELNRPEGRLLLPDLLRSSAFDVSDPGS